VAARAFIRLLLLALAVLAGGSAALAQECPPYSEMVKEEREGRTVRLFCRCVAGYTLVNNRCERSPELDAENNQFRYRYEAWLRKIHDAVIRERGSNRVAVVRVTAGMESLTPPTVTISDLFTGDILMLAPADPVGHVIDVLTGKGGASHALVYLGRTPNGMLFLDHTEFDPLRPEQGGGTHIIGERQFRQQYGARQLYAARVLDHVDGRQILQQALALAARDTRQGGWRSFRPTTFNLLGTAEDDAACSVRMSMTVFKATGRSPADLDAHLKGLRIWDLSPNSFSDPALLGKYFVTFPVQR
jgi:hypothetical protein